MGGKEVDMSTEGLDPVYLAARAALSQCVVCLRPMRPASSKAADWPATVAYGTASQCKTCYNRSYKKSLSVAGVAKVEGKKTRYRGVEKVVPHVVLPRKAVAESWSAEERSAALMVCEVAGSASVAGEILEMLGLFEVDRREVIDGSIGNFRSPRS